MANIHPKTLINNLQMILTIKEAEYGEDYRDLLIEDIDEEAIEQAIKAVKALYQVKADIKQLKKDFIRQRDEYSDGLRKGLQCIEATIEENMS